MTNDAQRFMSSAGLALAALITLHGCEQKPAKDSPPPSATTTESPDHPTEGPHQGSLIELGNEEYHAELVHDEQTASIAIYILGSSATQAVPIDATELTVNLSRDGQAEQFSLAASPEPSDPAGQSSRFTSSDPELAESLDNADAEAQLVVTINGKQYRGAIAHDHAGHAHE